MPDRTPESGNESLRQPRSPAQELQSRLARIDRGVQTSGLNADRARERLSEALIDAIRFRIGGREVCVQKTVDVTERYFARHDIPYESLGIYMENVERAQARLQRVLEGRPGWQGGVRFDGRNFIAQDATSGKRLLATAHFVLEQEPSSAKRQEYALLDEHGNRREGTKITENTTDRAAATYQVFDASSGTRWQRMHIRSDGSLALQQYHTAEGQQWRETDVRWYAEDGALSVRPRIISVTADSASVTLPVRRGSAEIITYALQRGKYVVPAEGAPIGKLDASKVRSLPERQQREALGRHAQELAGSLATPEAIGTWISTNMEFVPSKPLTDAHLKKNLPPGVQFRSESGTQHVQHPLWTLREGQGDCEDIAILAQDLLQRSGITSLVVQQYSNHYLCAFVQERATGEGLRYELCVIDSNGFRAFSTSKNDGAPFRSPADALRDIWKTGEGKSGAHWELNRIRGMRGAEDYRRHVEKVVEQGGGIILLQSKPGVSYDDLPLAQDLYQQSSDKLDDGIYSFDEDWSDIVRKS
jgi:hypothetical protein